MAKINLLPWREERRKERQNEFYAVIALVIAAAAAIVLAVNTSIDGSISDQKTRNAYITKESRILDSKISEIKDLNETREKLLERMEVIQSLQGDRPIIVRVFDEAARSVPEDLFLTEFGIKGTKVTIKGRAKSNNRVAALMRNFDASDWFADPNLIKVQSVQEGSNEFEVTMTRIRPSSDDEGEG
ncbi:MAG: pilus assembly protein PilN [Oceanospirillaceae bacterium]|nr:pilus assembly protein PilN [Oceanospirillaceae bacterium]MBT11691.1 pilus assembly protein PilN [Oceanospirillaceae bacterium]|tara:strand:+ start:2152 stop:2709 length:558 start_codon:yes stop_codon:yes gene_type:complete